MLTAVVAQPTLLGSTAGTPWTWVTGLRRCFGLECSATACRTEQIVRARECGGVELSGSMAVRALRRARNQYSTAASRTSKSCPAAKILPEGTSLEIRTKCAREIQRAADLSRWTNPQSSADEPGSASALPSPIPQALPTPAASAGHMFRKPTLEEQPAQQAQHLIHI